jgi:hypothetical protein
VSQENARQEFKGEASLRPKTMKKCSYCGAEYSDDTIICPIDQTALDKTRLTTEPLVVPAIKRKIPIRLSIVSYCFFASGICYLGWFGLAAYLGKFLLLNLIIGFLNLFVSRGLRRCSNQWRICALVLVCLCCFDVCFRIVHSFTHLTHVPILFIVIAWPLDFLVLIWFYRTLTRQDIRDLFYDKPEFNT